MAGNKISLHRIIKASLEKVYKAFVDVNSLALWIHPNGFTGKSKLYGFESGRTL